MDCPVQVEGLRKNYGEVAALKGIDFEVRAGEVFGLLGPNGAGKTTTVEILEGLRSRSGGRVTVLGCDPEVQTKALKDRKAGGDRLIVALIRPWPTPSRSPYLDPTCIDEGAW